MNKITVKEWIEKFNNGEFDKADYETQCAAGWYDWFCSDYRSKLYFVVQCGHPYGSEYMYEICTARNNYSAEFKCRNKKEVLEAIEHLAEDFRKEINEKK